MGKKHNKHKSKQKATNSYDMRYRSRRERLLSLYDEEYINLKYPTKEARREFENYVLLNADRILMDFEKPQKSLYEEQLKDIKSKKVGTLDEVALKMYDIKQVQKKIDKNKKYKNGYKKDLSIASYVNDKRYKKKILSNKKYKKSLKELAKLHKKELKEMKRLGYVSNGDKLDKLLKKESKKSNDNYNNALFDAYIQKYGF